MDDPNHPDEIERLRIALWGEGPSRTGAAARHVEVCRGCSDDIAFHRRVRDAFRRWSGAEPSADAMADAFGSARIADGVDDFGWIPATPVGPLADVRSAVTADVHVVADADGFSLEAMLHAADGSRFAVSGQVSRPDALPAADLPVALLVDGREVAETVTDEFGEFAFGPRAGARWGLRVGAGAETARIEILRAESGR